MVSDQGDFWCGRCFWWALKPERLRSLLWAREGPTNGPNWMEGDWMGAQSMTFTRKIESSGNAWFLAFFSPFLTSARGILTKCKIYVVLHLAYACLVSHIHIQICERLKMLHERFKKSEYHLLKYLPVKHDHWRKRIINPRLNSKSDN